MPTLVREVTGYVQESDRRRATEAGFDHHVVKPVKLDGGRPWRILGTLTRIDNTNVGDQRSLADQLRLSEHRFETFVDGLPQLAWECDADGWIDYYNQPWYRYTGTTLDEIRNELPDVIVSDLAMPEIDGFAFIQRVRSSADERLRSLPVIALTAHASAQDRADALARGFTSYLSKPYDAGPLCRPIAEVVARGAIP